MHKTQNIKCTQPKRKCSYPVAPCKATSLLIHDFEGFHAGGSNEDYVGQELSCLQHFQRLKPSKQSSKYCSPIRSSERNCHQWLHQKGMNSLHSSIVTTVIMGDFYSAYPSESFTANKTGEKECSLPPPDPPYSLTHTHTHEWVFFQCEY